MSLWYARARAAAPLDGLVGNIDFRLALQKSLSNVKLSWRISDHFPLWASFSVRADVVLTRERRRAANPTTHRSCGTSSPRPIRAR